MKRILAIVLALFVTVGFGLTGCKTGPSDDPGSSESSMVDYKCSMESCDRTKTAEVGAAAPT